MAPSVPARDIEKDASTGADAVGPAVSGSSSSSSASLPPSNVNGLLATLGRWNVAIESLSGFEARGIVRVPPDERQPPSLWDDISVALLWFSANISVNNLTVGLFGPLLFGLGFVDSAMCAVFGALLGSLSTAYMSVWGHQSGNRTMVR